MKNEKGVTLTALAITIIVIFILASISINYGVDTLNESKAKNLEASLAIVEQAIAEQYIKAVELRQDSIKSTDSKPEIFVGTMVNANDLPEIGGGKEFLLKEKLQGLASNNLTYSECYYRLEPADLTQLKIESDDQNKYTYIVNYSTGEVFNETKKKTSTGTILYYSGKTGNKRTQATEINKEEDKSSFVE